MIECEIPEFYNEHYRTARMQHRCCETDRVIRKGDRYWSCTGKWDGDVETYKQSESAYHFARWLNGQMDGCVCFGNVSEAVGEWPLESMVHDVWADICSGLREFGAGDEV